MIEFWAVIGLACLDHVFLAELTKYKADVEGTIREYGFRLSRYEMGELKRILRIPDAVSSMHNICKVAWAQALNDEAPCGWSAARSAKHDPEPDPHPYRHPLENDPAVEKGGSGMHH